MTKEILLTGMTLGEVISAIDSIKPNTFGHTIEIRSGAPLTLDDGTIFVATSIVPVKFGGTYIHSKLAKLEADIRACDSAGKFATVSARMEALRPEQQAYISPNIRAMYADKKEKVEAGRPIYAVEKIVREAPKLDTERPYITYAKNGAVQISCATAFQWDLRTGCFVPAKNRYYLIDGDTVEILTGDTAEEKKILAASRAEARVTAKKKATSSPTPFMKPRVENIIAIK